MTLMVPPVLYRECGNLVTGSPHMYDMMWMWEPCNSQWQEPCNGVSPSCMIRFECENLVTVNDGNCVTSSPHMYWEPCNCQWWEPCTRVPPHVQCKFFLKVNDRNFVMGSPHITGNFVTVNDRNLVMGFPHMYYVIFLGWLCKRTTACPNHNMCEEWIMLPVQKLENGLF